MTRRPSLAALPIALAVSALAGWTSPILAQSGAEAAARREATEVRPRVVQPERAFGRMLGDVLVQRVRIAEEETIGAAALPPEGRVDAWFARLPSRLVDDRVHGRHVELRHQIVNSPLAATTVSLPPTELAIDGGGSVSVAPWPVVIVPLLPGASGNGVSAVGSPAVAASAAAEALPDMRPDRLLPPLDTAALRARARATAILLGAVLLGWALWWRARRRRDGVRLPFARARSVLRRLDAGQREESPAAWRAAHAALNATAGRVSGPTTIDALLARAPWLQPHRERLVAFHDASVGRFFEQPPRVEPFALQAFVHDLERAERRRAR